MNKHIFESAASKSIAWIMIVIMTFLSAVSFLFRSYIDVTYQEIIYYRRDNVILAAAFLAIFLASIWYMRKKNRFSKIPEKTLLAVLLVYAAAVSGLWAYASHSFPVADQKSVLDCVEGMMNGNYECMIYKGYLQYNRHQVGLTFFYELFFRVFTGGEVSYQAVYVLNTAMITGIFLELYLITKELTRKKEIVILELLLSFGMFQLMLYSTFVYGLIPGLFFALAGILSMLKLLKTKKWYYGLTMAVTLALAVVLKSNYLIFVIAVAGVLFVKTISEKKWMYLLFAILAVAGFAALNQGAQTVYENRSGIEFGDTIPNSIYIAMGMQESSMAPGWFNGYNHVTYRNNGYDQEVTDRIAKEYIAERVAEFAENPLECLKFYYYKIVSQWNEVTYECFWISTNQGNHTRELSPLMKNFYTGSLHTLAEAFMNLYQLLLFCGTLCMAWFVRKNKDVSKLILIICVLGGFFFHIMWEGKSQYIISYFPLMLPCAAAGFFNVIQAGEKKNV